MGKYKFLTAAALASLIAVAHPAFAAPAAPTWGGPVTIDEGVTFDPILEGRLRYEHVDQDDIGLDADAVTVRLRAGGELKLDHLSFLAEGEGTLAIVDNYNAFPGALGLTNNQFRPGYSVVADPMNIELNRIQLAYRKGTSAVTVGRQRINLDDQRWVGSVGWRQNEQTFDAVRGEFKVGPVSFDGTYSISQRTIQGIDGGRHQGYDGNFFFLGASAKVGPVQVKGFSYLLDYKNDEPLSIIAKSSQTYGLRATTSLPLTKDLKLNAAASYARQMDYNDNTGDFGVDYIAAEGGLSYAGFTALAGYELLGSDDGLFALQTPMATLHKFNGWADVFLTTPSTGLQDLYLGAAYKFDGIKMLPGLNAAVTWHQYDSDFADIEFGHEWNASLGFKVGPVGLLAKYANYDAVSFPATGDVEKFWLQAEFAF